MSQNQWIRLSPYVLPQVRQGLHTLQPQNLCPGPDRLAYADALIGHMQHLLAHGQTQEAKRYREYAPWAMYLTSWVEDPETNKITIEPIPEMKNALSLHPEELGVLLVDGRIRDDSQMAYLPAGEGTPALLGLLRLLHRGIQRNDFLRQADAADVGFDEELLQALIDRGAVIPCDGPVPTVRAPEAGAMTWLGHAFVQASCAGRSIWVDPYPMPRMTWSDEEIEAMAAASVPDTFLLRDYGPNAHHVTQDELPIPEAVFVTHQDSDHLDLGAVAMLPANVPIYVPYAEADKPWQIDMVKMIHTILGADRDVRVFRHGESVSFGDLKVTAIPFVGEFPVSLPHHWNCFLVELPNQVWALCADSAITPMQIDVLRAKLEGNVRPFGMMINGIKPRDYSLGYRDSAEEVWSFGRVYSWYLPPWRLFEKGPESGLPLGLIPRLVKECGMTKFYPYAHGNLPWYRMQGTYLLQSHIGSHDMNIWHQMERIGKEHGFSVERLRHGEPYQADTLTIPKQLRK